MKVAALPELFRRRRIVEVSHRQPRRADDDFSSGAAVVSDVLHRSIHDAEVDQRHRRSGLGAKLDLLVEVSGQLVLLELSDRQDGTGLRHAIAREDVDATLHRGLGQRFGQRRTPDHHFQFGKIDILAVGSRQQHL